MNNKPALVSIIIVVLVVLLVVIYKITAGRQPAQTLPPPSAGVLMPSARASSGTSMLHAVIYTLSPGTDADPNGLTAHSIVLKHPDSPVLEALNALAAAPDSPLPPGTKLRGVTIRDGLATADFSPEFKTSFPGGDTREAQVISAIRQTLGQFPDIQTVQILVGGKAIDTLGGMIDLSSPIPVIRSDNPRTAKRTDSE